MLLAASQSLSVYSELPPAHSPRSSHKQDLLPWAQVDLATVTSILALRVNSVAHVLLCPGPSGLSGILAAAHELLLGSYELIGPSASCELNCTPNVAGYVPDAAIEAVETQPVKLEKATKKDLPHAQSSESMKASRRPHGWQSAAEWGITQVLTHFGCCHVRTSSFDLDDLDRPASNSPPQIPHTPPQHRPGTGGMQKANSWRPLQEINPLSSPDTPLQLQRAQSQPGLRRKVSFNLPKDSSAGSPSKTVLLQGSAPSHAHTSDESDDEEEDIYATADEDEVLPSSAGRIPEQTLAGSSPFAGAKPFAVQRHAELRQGQLVCIAQDAVEADALHQQLQQYLPKAVGDAVRLLAGSAATLMREAPNTFEGVLVARQDGADAADLIASALQACKPGGRVVYLSAGASAIDNDTAVTQALKQHHHIEVANEEALIPLQSSAQKQGHPFSTCLQAAQQTKMGWLIKEPKAYQLDEHYLAVIKKCRSKPG